MDSVGSTLKECREAKGYSITQVSADIHILPSYIEALEENRFQDLPGKAYCLGFIKSLAKYYGINGEELVAFYKGETYVEKEAEPEEDESTLVQSIPYTEKSNKKLFIIAGLALLIAVCVFAFIFVSKLEMKSNGPVAKKSAGTMYVMEEVFFEREFAQGDIIRLHLENGDSDIICDSVGPDVIIRTKAGSVSLKMDNDVLLDLDGDNKNDVKVILKDVDIGQNTAVLRFDRALEAPISKLPTIQVAPNPDSTIMHDKGSVKILDSPMKRDFVIIVEFLGTCYLRYQADSQGMVEKSYKQGEQLRLGISDEIKLWLSNAGMARILIGSNEIFLGNKGDVTSEKICWEETADKNYNLSIISMH